MTAPQKVEPTLEVLQTSWAWRSLAYRSSNWEQCFTWRDAFDILLDNMLADRPDLSWVWTTE